LGGVLPNKSQVLIWDATGQAYVTASKIAGVWNSNVNLGPGQGYFIKPSAVATWNETLQIQ
jgi:hypothetical protein